MDEMETPPAGMKNIVECRGCRSSQLRELIAFGPVPLADRLRTNANIDALEPRFPLTLLFCSDCSLVQIRETVAPEILFGADYPYYASFSTSWLDHCRQSAEQLIRDRSLSAHSLVIEIASNDGYLLKNFTRSGIPALGIDPAPGPAAAAEQLGISTLREFFTLELARQLRANGTCADVILGNNVLAHVRDLSGFVYGLREILKPGGVVVIEAPYVRDLIERCAFDTIYHEHLCYFSVTSLNRLFGDRGLVLQDVERLSTHGGSLRLFVQHSGDQTERLRNLLAEEQRLGLAEEHYYSNFSRNVNDVRRELKSTLVELKQRNVRVAAYGAAAKGAMLLNACGIDDSLLEYVVD